VIRTHTAFRYQPVPFGEMCAKNISHIAIVVVGFAILVTSDQLSNSIRGLTAATQ
jgi:hypothetical protein